MTTMDVRYTVRDMTGGDWVAEFTSHAEAREWLLENFLIVEDFEPVERIRLHDLKAS